MDKKAKPLVAIVMGSDSDLNVMKSAAEMLEKFGVPFYIDVVSAHRTPEKLYDFARGAESAGFVAIIAGAGGAAHLPGMIASMTVLPVIGVPVKPSTYTGEDSILSILQMPPGVPVATMALNGAANAGILAAQIVGTTNAKVREKVRAYKKELSDMVAAKSAKLQKLGWGEYLEKELLAKK